MEAMAGRVHVQVQPALHNKLWTNSCHRIKIKLRCNPVEECLLILKSKAQGLISTVTTSGQSFVLLYLGHRQCSQLGRLTVGKPHSPSP